MANRQRGFFDDFKDTLQKNRNKIVYVLVLAGFFLALAGWGLLPDQVGMQFSHGVLLNFMDKNTALLAHLAITLGFSGMFWWKPREIVYLVGAILGILLSVGVLASNLGMV